MKEMTPAHPIVRELVGSAYPISLYILSYLLLSSSESSLLLYVFDSRFLVFQVTL